LECEIQRLRQSPIPPEAQRLAAQIPKDAGKYGLALKAIAERRFDDADRPWDELIQEKKAEVARLIQMKGRTEYFAGRYNEAIKLYDEAKTLLPDDPSILMDFAVLRTVSGSYKEAVPLFDRTLDLLQAARSPDHLTIAMLLNTRALIFQ